VTSDYRPLFSVRVLNVDHTHAVFVAKLAVRTLSRLTAVFPLSVSFAELSLMADRLLDIGPLYRVKSTGFRARILNSIPTFSYNSEYLR